MKHKKPDYGVQQFHHPLTRHALASSREIRREYFPADRPDEDITTSDDPDERPQNNLDPKVGMIYLNKTRFNRNEARLRKLEQYGN